MRRKKRGREGRETERRGSKERKQKQMGRRGGEGGVVELGTGRGGRNSTFLYLGRAWGKVGCVFHKLKSIKTDAIYLGAFRMQETTPWLFPVVAYFSFLSSSFVCLNAFAHLHSPACPPTPQPGIQEGPASPRPQSWALCLPQPGLSPGQAGRGLRAVSSAPNWLTVQMLAGEQL